MINGELLNLGGKRLAPDEKLVCFGLTEYSPINQNVFNFHLGPVLQPSAIALARHIGSLLG